MDSGEIWPPGIIDAGAWSAGEINRVSILAEREVFLFFLPAVSCGALFGSALGLIGEEFD